LAKLAITFGVLLIALGLGTYLPRHEHPTALIPAVAGLLLLACGLVARNERLRMHAMHAAALVGMLGALAAGGRMGMSIAKGTFGENAQAATGLAGMFVLCALFVALCVRSFIAARRVRQQA